MPVLTVDDVRTFLSDTPDDNRLLDDEEFSDKKIAFCMRMACDTYNHMPPSTGFNLENFPSQAVLLNGTLASLYQGAMALLARNHLSYSDGGVSVPVEERYELYERLATQYQNLFEQEAEKLKRYQNIEAGYGFSGSDMSFFPYW